MNLRAVRVDMAMIAVERMNRRPGRLLRLLFPNPPLAQSPSIILLFLFINTSISVIVAV